jgi:light-harvesting complex 1 beta chain
MAERTSFGRGDASAWDSALAGCAFAVCFTVFLVIALVSQALFLPWRSWLPGAEQTKSITGGVTSAVYSLLSHIP